MPTFHTLVPAAGGRHRDRRRGSSRLAGAVALSRWGRRDRHPDRASNATDAGRAPL